MKMLPISACVIWLWLSNVIKVQPLIAGAICLQLLMLPPLSRNVITECCGWEAFVRCWKPVNWFSKKSFFSWQLTLSRITHTWSWVFWFHGLAEEGSWAILGCSCSLGQNLTLLEYVMCCCASVIDYKCVFFSSSFFPPSNNSCGNVVYY